MDKRMFGLKVKTLREHKNLSQSKFAEMIDISDTALSNIETGKCFPRMNTLIAMSEALNVSIHFLIADDSDAVKICLEEIDKCMFIFNEDISEHIMEYFNLCLKLDSQMKNAKKEKDIVFDWFKPRD